MTTTDTVTETVWSRALAELREKGWTKGSEAFAGEGEATCLALAVVHQTTDAIPSDKWTWLYDAVGIPTEEREVSALYEWNDAPERTFEEVEEVLLRLHNRELEERK